MQSTVYGNHCKVKAKKREDAALAANAFFWDEADFSKLGLQKFGIDADEQLGRISVRCFKAWLEEWERDNIRKNHSVSEARLLEKYGGLRFYDDEGHFNVTICANDMCWSTVKGAKGWCVKALKDSYDPKTNPDAFQPWSIDYHTNDLHDVIAAYYEKHPEATVKIINRHDDDGDDSNSSASYNTDALYA
jgi:hypothetical protein